MAHLIIAQGPARTGKTYTGTKWVAEDRDNRVMYDGEVESAIRSLDLGRDVWLNINTEYIPQGLIITQDFKPRHSVEIKKFTKVYQPKQTLSVKWFNFKKKLKRLFK